MGAKEPKVQARQVQVPKVQAPNVGGEEGEDRGIVEIASDDALSSDLSDVSFGDVKE